MEKKRLLISFSKLPNEVLDVIKVKYPYGYNHHLMEVKGMNNQKLYVLPIETNEATYLVKVDLKKPVSVADLDEFYNDEEEDAPAFTGDGDDLPSEEIVVDEDE